MFTTPPSLLEQLRHLGASDAWEHFVKLYTPLLLHWARGLGLRQQDAEDLVQDVFLVLVQKLPQFRYDPNKSFRAWLRTVTLNKWKDRRPPPGRPRQVGSVPPAQQAILVSPELFEEAEYRQHVLGRALRLMQTDFEPMTWRAFWECVVAERPAKEVAAELGLSGPGAVYSATFRVMDRLRKELRGLLD
jgi:RNA polymerase sigma-70 factor (ECF subfamily)